MKTILAIAILALASIACQAQSLIPEDVTPAELALVEQCKSFQTPHWPVGTPVVFTSIHRFGNGVVEVGINMTFWKKHPLDVDLVKRKIGYMGSCQFQPRGAGFKLAEAYRLLAGYSDAPKAQISVAPSFEWH